MTGLMSVIYLEHCLGVNASPESCLYKLLLIEILLFKVHTVSFILIGYPLISLKFTQVVNIFSYS